MDKCVFLRLPLKELESRKNFTLNERETGNLSKGLLRCISVENSFWFWGFLAKVANGILKS